MRLVPHVNKLREAADVITALENILGIISCVLVFFCVFAHLSLTFDALQKCARFQHYDIQRCWTKLADRH